MCFHIDAPMEIFVQQGAKVMATLAPLLRQKLIFLVRLEFVIGPQQAPALPFEEELFARNDFFQGSFNRAPDPNLGLDSHDSTRDAVIHNRNC